MARRSHQPVAGRRRAVPAPAPAPAQRRPRYLLTGLFGAAVAVVAAAVLIGNVLRGEDRFVGVAGDVANAGAGAGATVKQPFPAEARVKGSPTAPVTIIEYSDLQCPNCGAFALSVMPRIEQEYVATGKVRIETREFAFLGKESTRAALASECAGEQGQFYEYRQAIYRNQRGENRGQFSDANLRMFADRSGLDGEALGACMTDGTYDDRIKADFQSGKMMGVDGTPTFFINGYKVVGALPYEEFKAILDQQLAAVGQK